MFTGFFYLLRAHGFRVSLNEWMTLIEGLMLDLQHDSLTGFYELCRAVLVKSEADYDKFDQIFLEYFDGVPYQDELPKELMDWLNNPAAAMEEFRKFLRTQGYEEKSIEEILKMFEERLKEQTEEHNGGSYWIGTNGYSNFGNSGHSPQGIRVGGKSMYRRAFQVAGERRFRDFRKDNVLDIRQFQMAFRLLRELSRKLETSEEELDIRGTIDHTCRRGGILDIRMQPPRKNRLKVMILIDSGGSMRPYEQLCSLLFQSLHKANTFSDLKIYYFHNCLEQRVYEDPEVDPAKSIKTDWILRNISSEYKVIFVGDADMAIHELMDGSGSSWSTASDDGITWFRRFREKYPHSIWLHPQEREQELAWMPESFVEIEKVFPMFRLSIDGLKDGMYKLMRGN